MSDILGAGRPGPGWSCPATTGRRGTHPPLDFPEYRSTRLRIPRQPWRPCRTGSPR